MGPPAREAREYGREALAYLLPILVLWSVLPLLLQTVPHADNVEQLNWAHSLEWGYLKHPPLPTWLLHGAEGIFGPSALLTYALAMGCVGASLLILWRCARRLLDPGSALVVLLLSSLDYYLMGRGSFLNHNTVMLPFVAASAWAVLRILQGAGWTSWLLLGLAQALGMLTKYQMAVIILANALALLSMGAWRQKNFARNATIACVATLLPLAPHAIWLQQHDFSSFSYAGHSLLADLPLGKRLQHTVGFLLQQVGRLAPAALGLGFALLLARAYRGTGTGNQRAQASDGGALRAVAILALVPLGTVLALCLFAGVAPQNHWGASTTLLLPFFAVVCLRAGRRPPLRATLLATIALQGAAVAWNVVAAERAPGFHHIFAARPLAAQALATWQSKVPGPLAIVIGPDWEAGALALELPSHPAVIASGDRAQSPWVSDDALRRCGALVFWRPDEAPAQQVGAIFAQHLQEPQILRATGAHGRESAIAVALLAPTQTGCAPGLVP